MMALFFRRIRCSQGDKTFSKSSLTTENCARYIQYWLWINFTRSCRRNWKRRRSWTCCIGQVNNSILSSTTIKWRWLLVDVWKTIYIWWWEFWRASRLGKKKAAVRSNTWERISMVVVRLILISLRNFCEEIAKKWKGVASL